MGFLDKFKQAVLTLVKKERKFEKKLKKADKELYHNWKLHRENNNKIFDMLYSNWDDENLNPIIEEQMPFTSNYVISKQDRNSDFLKMVFSNRNYKEIFLNPNTSKEAINKLDQSDFASFISYLSSINQYTSDQLFKNMKFINVGRHSPLSDTHWIHLKPELFHMLRPSVQSVDTISRELKTAVYHNNLLKTLLTAMKNAKIIYGDQLINKLENGVDAISTEIRNGKFIDINNNEVSNDDLVTYLTNAVIYTSFDGDKIPKEFQNIDFSKRLKLKFLNIEYKNLLSNDFTYHQIFNSFINVSDHPNTKQPPYDCFIVDFTLEEDSFNSISVGITDKITLKLINDLLAIKLLIYNNFYYFVHSVLYNKRKMWSKIGLDKRNWYGLKLNDLCDNGSCIILRGNSYLSPSNTESIKMSEVIRQMYTIDQNQLRYVILKNLINYYEIIDDCYDSIETFFNKEINQENHSQTEITKMQNKFNSFRNTHKKLVKKFFKIITKENSIVSDDDIDILLNENLSIKDKKDRLLIPEHLKKWFELKDDVRYLDLGYQSFYKFKTDEKDDELEDKLIIKDASSKNPRNKINKINDQKNSNKDDLQEINKTNKTRKLK